MAGHSSPVDDATVAAVADRDPDAVAAVYEALADPLFRYVRSRCACAELAADVVEATFVELIHTAPRLEDGIVGARRWLFTAARHNLLDEQRKQRRRGDLPLPGPYSEGASRETHQDAGRRGPTQPLPELTPEEQVVAAERDEEVRGALALLPVDEREVLELRFAGELSAAEAGEVMGRSAGAVRVLQHRALKRLARALGERDPDATTGHVPADGAHLRRDRTSMPGRDPPEVGL